MGDARRRATASRRKANSSPAAASSSAVGDEPPAAIAASDHRRKSSDVRVGHAEQVGDHEHRERRADLVDRVDRLTGVGDAVEQRHGPLAHPVLQRRDPSDGEAR